MAAVRAENQASSEGARTGNAERLMKTHVVRNSGGAAAILNTGFASQADSLSASSAARMRPEGSCICICGMITGAGNWLRAMVALGHAADFAGAVSW